MHDTWHHAKYGSNTTFSQVYKLLMNNNYECPLLSLTPVLRRTPEKFCHPLICLANTGNSTLCLYYVMSFMDVP
jgi:hypothetical protein